MSVKYHVVARPNPNDRAAPIKYYPSVKSQGRVGLREISERIEAISTISSIDVVAVLEALLVVICDVLAEGKIIELGDIGSIGLRMSGRAADSPEKVGRKHILKVLPRFFPGKRLKLALRRVDFVKTSRSVR